MSVRLSTRFHRMVMGKGMDIGVGKGMGTYLGMDIGTGMGQNIFKSTGR